MNKKIIFIVSALCSGGAFQSMGVYGVNHSTSDGSPEDNSQKRTNPYKIFLRMAAALSPNGQHPEKAFNKLKKLTKITDRSFIPRAQGIIKTLKVCVNKSPNILALSQALRESPYSRSFQEILENELIKSDVDFIKKQMHGKGNKSSIKERIAKSQIDFFGFFEENYLFHDDQTCKELFWNKIIDYNTFSKSPLFVQWGTDEDLESHQEGTASPTLSASASFSSAPPPPPSTSAPPPPPTSTATSAPPAPLPSISARQNLLSEILKKVNSKNSQNSKDVGLSGFLKPPELSLNLGEIFSDPSDRAHFVKSINEHINECFPKTHQDSWKVCLENYMEQGKIADNEESRDAFRGIITIGQLGISEQKNNLPKKFVDLLKQYLDQNVFSASALSAWDQLMGELFNDSKSPENQRRKWEKSKENFENSLGINEKKQNVSRLQKEIQKELNQEKKIDESFKMFGKKLFSTGNDYRKKRNELNRAITYFTKYPPTEKTLLSLFKNVEQKFGKGGLDSYFMSKDEQTEFAKYDENKSENSYTISKKEKELENEEKRINYILSNTKAISEFFEFMKHLSSFYEQQKQKIENLLPPGQTNAINAKEIKNPDATFEDVKDRIDFDFVLDLICKSNKKYCQKTEELIIKHFFYTTKDLNSIIDIAKKYLRIDQELTAPQCIKNLYDSKWDLRMMILKKIYGEISLEDCCTAIGLIYKDNGAISRPKALYYLIHHKNLLVKRDTESVLIKKPDNLNVLKQKLECTLLKQVNTGRSFIQKLDTKSVFIEKLEITTMTVDEIYEFVALPENSSLSPTESLDYLLNDSSELPDTYKNDFVKKIFKSLPENERYACIVSYYQSIFTRTEQELKKNKNDLESLENEKKEQEKTNPKLSDEIRKTESRVKGLKEDSEKYEKMTDHLKKFFERKDIQGAVKFLYGLPNLLGGETTHFFCKFLLDEIPELLEFIKSISPASHSPIEIIKNLNKKFKIKDSSVEIKILKEILKEKLEEKELFSTLLSNLNTSIEQQNKYFVELCEEFLKNPHFEITTQNKELIEKIINSWRTLNPEALDSKQNPAGQKKSGGSHVAVQKVPENKDLVETLNKKTVIQEKNLAQNGGQRRVKGKTHDHAI